MGRVAEKLLADLLLPVDLIQILPHVAGHLVGSLGDDIDLRVLVLLEIKFRIVPAVPQHLPRDLHQCRRRDSSVPSSPSLPRALPLPLPRDLHRCRRHHSSVPSSPSLRRALPPLSKVRRFDTFSCPPPGSGCSDTILCLLKYDFRIGCSDLDLWIQFRIGCSDLVALIWFRTRISSRKSIIYLDCHP